MPDDKKEIRDMLSSLPVPEASEGLENRILEAAKREKASQDDHMVHMHDAMHKQARQMYWQINGPRYALAASIVALLILLMDPVGLAGEYYIAQKAEERYTVDGVPLLADVEIVEEEFDYVSIEEFVPNP